MKSTTYHKGGYEFELVAENENGDNMEVFLNVKMAGLRCDLMAVPEENILPSVWLDMLSHFQYVFGQPKDYDRGDVA